MINTFLANIEPMHPIGVALLVGGGGFGLLGAIKNWDWFFMFPPGPLYDKLFGRTGARIVVALLSIFILVFGVLAALGKV